MRPGGAGFCAIGAALLGLSLMARHNQALHHDLLIGVMSWAGSLAVIIGVGRMLFLE